MSTFQWDDAPCIGRTKLFYSVKREEIRRAINLCNACPHINACSVLGKNERHGIWGGEFKGFPSSPSAITLKKRTEKQDKLSKDAERLGLDFEHIKRAIGY